MFYEDMHDIFICGVKVIVHSISLICSALVGVYDSTIILTRGVSTIATKLLLKLGVKLIIEGVSAVANFLSDLMSALHQWLVVDGFIDGNPDFFRVFLSLQRSLWVSRELLIEPCDMLRNFWESFLSPSSYYPPQGAQVRLDDYYFPEPEILPQYEVFNKWCFSQNLTGLSRSSDAHIPELTSYDPEYQYCAMCDYDGGVRKDCVPYAYNLPLALNSIVVLACKLFQMPIQYLLRSRSIASNLASTVTRRTPIRKSKEVADFVLHLRTYGSAVAQPSDSRERFFTGDGVEMKYCVCWNSYTGYDDIHPHGVPVDKYLHHAPWLLCPSYAEGYRTYDMDGFFTAYLDAVGFLFDAGDEWFLNVFNYLQYVMTVDVVGNDIEVACEELWSVPKATYNETSDVCYVTPPALMAFNRHFLQSTGGVARIVGRSVAYLPTLLYEIADSWAELVDGSASQDHSNQEGLSHQLLETPNTIGCLRQDEAEYPSTTSQESVDVDVEHYCARNYVIDSMEGFMQRFADVVRAVHLEKEAAVLRSGIRAIVGKLRFSYRLGMVSLFGPYQVPPAPPAYPAPPAPPPFPPLAPKCLIPAVRITNISDSSDQFEVIGLEGWTAYECGLREANPMANYATHLQASNPDFNYSFTYQDKQWSYNEAPNDLLVDCFFLSAYDAYRANGSTHNLCPVPEGHEQDLDVEMCTLAGYPSPLDSENVDTSNLRTSPNVFTFSDVEQEQCLCDDDKSRPVDERTLYTCPTSEWYAPRRTRLDDKADTLLSYLVSADGSGSAWDESLGYYTREGQSDVMYPVCRGLQVTVLDRIGHNVSYDFMMRQRCSLSSSEYVDGLIFEGYGIQVECNLVAITDIANDTLRRTATFIISDEARVMRLPVRTIRRRLNATDDETMLSSSVELLAQGPSWTARFPEQAFNGSNSLAADPAWNEFMSIGGTGAGMHQPLCSCDPLEYVPPEPVREVRHCAPRVFENVPPPPLPPDHPTSPPPPYPNYPPLNNDTICRNSAGQVMAGYYMRYHPRDVFPTNCVCEFSGLGPISSNSGNVDDTVYCPQECDDSSTAEGPTCICRVRDISDFEKAANGGRAVPHYNETNVVDSALEDVLAALNALAVDVASPEADTPAYDATSQGNDLEYAFSFDFETEVDRFPDLHRATAASFCKDHLGPGWMMHNLLDDESTSANDFRERLQAMVDSRVNDYVMSATGAAFMDAHPLCADRYRVALPPRFNRVYTGQVNHTVRREVVGPARQAWRLASPRNLGDRNRYNVDDRDYLSKALYSQLIGASDTASATFTPSSCRVSDVELADMPLNSQIELLASSDGSAYHLHNVSMNSTCNMNEEVTLHKAAMQSYYLACKGRTHDATMYTAADAHNQRFDWTNALSRRAQFTLRPRSTTFGFMHYINSEGRVSLLNQSDQVSDVDDCALQFAFADTFSMTELRDSHSRVCEMYADETYLHNGLSADQHPKGRYTHAQGPLLKRYEVNLNHSACSNESVSDTQVLCHDANLLSPEQMAQAATFCGFSVSSESVQPVNARTSCRSIPLRVGMPIALSNAETSHLYDRGHRLVPVCSRKVSNVTRTRIATKDGDTESSTDGRRFLADDVLLAARAAVERVRSRSAKCALNTLRTFPHLDGSSTKQFGQLYRSARPNSVERMLVSDLTSHPSATPWPYPWTIRSNAANLTRVTIGAVLRGAEGERIYSDLSAIGATTDRLDVHGESRSARSTGPTRTSRGFVGNAQGGYRMDPFVYNDEVAFTMSKGSDVLFGTSVRSPLSQHVFVMERCNQDNSSEHAYFRIRSLSDNRFLMSKGTFPHPNMPSKSSNATQFPKRSRLTAYQADPGLLHERYHTDGAFEAFTPSEATLVLGQPHEGIEPAAARSSTMYMIEQHDEMYLVQSQDRLYEFGGYLFENDVHLSHGATADTRLAENEEVIAGDFDALGNVGLFGLSIRDKDHLPRARLEDGIPIAPKGRPRSYNRQLFTGLDRSRNPDAFCTRRMDNFDNTTVFEVPPYPQDSKVDIGDCDVLDRKVYNNWAKGYPTHGLGVGRDGLETTFIAGTFDCVALNVLSGSHCAIHAEHESEPCLIGRDVDFSEWVTLPCSQKKPFVCSKGNSDYHVVTNPLNFDAARLYCKSYYGESYDLSPAPTSFGQNTDLARQARKALCSEDLLNVYGSARTSVCDLSVLSSGADVHTMSSLQNLTSSGCGASRIDPLDGYACCDTTSAFLVGNFSGEVEIVRNRVGVYTADGSCERKEAGSHARGSFYSNSDSITYEDEIAGGSAWNLQFGDVWIGYRRHTVHEGFSDQRFGQCDVSNSDATANSMLFEIVPLKDDMDAHVSGEFSIVGKDGSGRSIVLALHQAAHPFDVRALGSAVATNNAEAYLYAINENRTLFAPNSISNAQVLLDDYRTMFEEVDAEHPLRPSVWTSRGSTLKLLEHGYRSGVSVANARSGRCFESPSNEASQLHNVSVIACNVEKKCGTVQFSVKVGVRTGLTLLPTDGETTEEVLQNMYPDLSLQRPRMRSIHSTSSRYRRLLSQSVNAESLLNWTHDANATLSAKDVFIRDSSLRSSGSRKPFVVNTSYGTRGAADTALQPGDRIRSLVFGGLHASADTTAFSSRRGVTDFRTYLHALNSSTYPCKDFSEHDDTYAYDVCAEIVDAGLSAPQISDVVAPSNCGNLAERSDSRCTLLALVTGRSLGFVEGVHQPPDTAETILLRRLDTVWNASEDSDVPSFFPESKDARHLRVLASRSNRRSLWYPSMQTTRDEILASDMQKDENNILASQGWLYTCSGRTLKFEPAASLDNPPFPSVPHAPMLTDLQNTNHGRFQVSSGGVLTQVSSTGESLLRRDVSEPYIVSHADSSVVSFQRAVDEHQPYRPHSGYNAYAFFGVEALSATVEYGAPERSSETISDCKTTGEHDRRACELYLEDVYLKGEMSDQRAKVDMRITHGASEASDQKPALDLHHVGGPRLRLPSEYTSGWQIPEKNLNRENVDLWIKGYSLNETGICGPRDTVRAYNVECDSTSGVCTSYTTEPISKCVQEESAYLETTAASVCGSYKNEEAVDDEDGLNNDPVLTQISQTNPLFFDDIPKAFRRVGCTFDSILMRILNPNGANGFYVSREQTCTFDMAYCDSLLASAERSNSVEVIDICKSIVRAVYHYCPATCERESWESTTRFVEGAGRLRLRDTEDGSARDGKRICTCTETAPDYHCRPIALNSAADEYTTLTGEKRQRPEVRFMSRFLREWRATPDPDDSSFNKIMPVVDMWNDAGAHGGSKYDTRFMWNINGANKGWEQDAGNVGPGRILVTFPYNNDDGDMLDYDPVLHNTSSAGNFYARAYSRSDRREFGLSLERMSDFSNKETFKRVSDLVADLCDDITYAYRRTEDTAGEEYGQPCMGFAAQDMYVYDGAPYDLDDMLSQDCVDNDACPEHRYQMMTSHYYPSYQSWKHHQSENTGWGSNRDGLLYALNKTRAQNPSGVYSDYMFSSDHRSSQENLYNSSGFGADLVGRGAIRAFLFTLYGKSRYATKEHGVRRREPLETLHVSHTHPWTVASAKRDATMTKHGRSGASRKGDIPNFGESYEAFLPVGAAGGARADDSIKNATYGRHSGYLYAAHTAMDLRERFYYPAFTYRVMSTDALNKLQNMGMIDTDTLERANSMGEDSKPIEILWPPPEVTLWSRVAEAERARVPSRELFGSFDASTTSFSETNGAWRLRLAPDQYKKAPIDGSCTQGVCADGAGEYFDHVENDVRPASPPDFGLLWNRYLRNRIPTCYRDENQGDAIFSKEWQTNNDCERLRPAYGYQEGRLGPEYVSPPPAPSFPNNPSPPPGQLSYDHFNEANWGDSTIVRTETVYYSQVGTNYISGSWEKRPLVEQGVYNHDECRWQCDQYSWCNTYTSVILSHSGQQNHIWCALYECGGFSGIPCSTGECQTLAENPDNYGGTPYCRIEYTTGGIHKRHYRSRNIESRQKVVLSPPPLPYVPVSPPPPYFSYGTFFNFDVYDEAYLLTDTYYYGEKYRYSAIWDDDMEALMCTLGEYESCVDKPYYLIARIEYLSETHDPIQSPESQLVAQGKNCTYFQGVALTNQGQNNFFHEDSCFARCESTDACELYTTLFVRHKSNTDDVYVLSCYLLRRSAHQAVFNLTQYERGSHHGEICAQIGVASRFSSYIQLTVLDNAHSVTSTSMSRTGGHLPLLRKVDTSIAYRFTAESPMVFSSACPYGDASEVLNADYVWNEPDDHYNVSLSARDICSAMGCAYYVQCGDQTAYDNSRYETADTVRFYLSNHSISLSVAERCMLSSTDTCVSVEPTTQYQAPDSQDWLTSHRRLYRSSWTYALAADSHLLDDAFRPKNNTPQALDRLSVPEHDGGYLDGNAFWQLSSFSWAFSPKHRCYPANCPWNEGDDSSYVLSRAMFHSKAMRQPAYLDLTDATEDVKARHTDEAYFKRWIKYGLSIALGQLSDDDLRSVHNELNALGAWICGEDNIDSVARESNRRRFHANGEGDVQVVGSRVVIKADRARGGIADGESLWLELLSAGRRICRAINENALRNLFNVSQNVPMPEEVVECDTTACTHDLHDMTPMWTICKGVSASTRSRGIGHYDDSSSDDARLTTDDVAIGFALDGLMYQINDITSVNITYMNELLDLCHSDSTYNTLYCTAYEGMRRTLAFTDCTQETWRGVSMFKKDTEWSDLNCSDVYSSFCDDNVTFNVGTCETYMIAEDVTIDASSDSKLVMYDTHDDSPSYDVADAEIDTNTLSVNLCASHSHKSMRALYSSDNFTRSVYLLNESVAEDESGHLECESEYCIRSRVRERWEDMPIIGTCAILIAPVDGKLFASDHGFFWGPSNTVSQGSVTNHRSVHSRSVSMSLHTSDMTNLLTSSDDHANEAEQSAVCLQVLSTSAVSKSVASTI
ncbi:hypothetical protein CYMTET_42768 [Cymbomonas tetramitiformis]|uniref:Uncharacterized protein n=1 Tax=Cymbomonas tetramitiformis TaxID=36881 RepID=A0AAE0F2B1_9CHLO|nr:hypothetical protein CYMTET_42768 [Cymbomonas tetramitiformis]